MYWKNVILALAGVCALSNAGFPDTIYVPDDHPTIQGAIDAAANGDEVIVRPGTYVENIDFKGRAIAVRSELGRDVTLIDGSNPADPDLGSVVTFQSGEGLGSVLDGFTIENGTGTREPGTSFFDGGGVYVGGIGVSTGASPTIVNNHIRNNSVNRTAGGISLIYGSSPDIIGNTISDNSAVYGAGMLMWQGSSPTIKNNFVHNNTASYEGGGIQAETNCSPIVENNVVMNNYAQEYAGGMLFWDQCSPTITNNIILDNQAEFNGGGGIFLTYYSTGVIEDNIIAGNTAGGTVQSGGGVLVDRWSDPLIVNNMIYGNTSPNGGGIDVQGSCSPTIVNNTIYGNSSNKGGGLACRNGSTAAVTNTVLWGNDALTGPEVFVATSPSSTVTISYSDVRGGPSFIHVQPGCTLNWGLGMIDTEPLFWNPESDDFHLQPGSPCIDAGDPNSPLDPDGSIADMGALPFDPDYLPPITTYCTAKPNSGGCTPLASFTGNPSMTGGAPFTIDAFPVSTSKNGLLFYGLSGPNASPFLGGTLCVQPPVRRAPLQNSGGSLPCTGTYTFDFNAWIQGGHEPLIVFGSQVNAQYWSRDPGDPWGVGLTDAVEFFVGP